MKPGIGNILCLCFFADLAHLVERDLAKVEVAGSIPVIRSIQKGLLKTSFLAVPFAFGE